VVLGVIEKRRNRVPILCLLKGYAVILFVKSYLPEVGDVLAKYCRLWVAVVSRWNEKKIFLS
jgi:hypothetical protein